MIASFRTTYFFLILPAVIVVQLALMAIAQSKRKKQTLRTGVSANRCLVEDEVDLQISRSNAVDAVLEVFRSIDVRQSEFRESEMRAEAVTGFTWRSFGQWITVDFSELGLDSSHLVVRSWPRYETTIYDWGASRLAVNSIINGLKSKLGSDSD